ncbi:MAG: PDDEXK nuclease domain-containing protein [Myxococcota bacterium]|jgi:predicted nuclease of restriction endonuclease-like (RecB) superfamily|nr:PDDEXK nuclease domain-containing protein [Myxococcota bacterium]
MSQLVPTTADCLARIRQILASARGRALQSVNVTMLSAYWEIGREIVEEEQRGQERAEYGARLIQQLSERLTVEYGRGYSEANLRQIRQFFLTFRDRQPPIRYMTSTGSSPALASPPGEPSPEIQYTACTESAPPPGAPLSERLSWSHYRVLMRVDRPEARAFYEVECIKAGWAVAELHRQIASLLFERLARSRDREGVLALARDGHEVQQASDLVKDPYILEFVGLPEVARWVESDLEQALIDGLQKFLLELGRDLFLVGRQKRITIDGDHFYVDLVFYHRVLRCFLLIDLKVGRLTQQDIGQMLLYTGWFEAEQMLPDENPPIGLILCTDKNEAVVRYTLGQKANQVYASRYQLHLPTEEQLALELQRERLALDAVLAASEPLDEEKP